MTRPLEVVIAQAKKSNLSEEELNALVSAQAKVSAYRLGGYAFGMGMGFILIKKPRPLWVRGASAVLLSMFLGNVSGAIGSVRAFRDLNNGAKYPHIKAAIDDIAEEIYRARGIDPRGSRPKGEPRGSSPNGDPRVIFRRPDFKNLPPSVTSEEKKSMQINMASGYEDNANSSDDTWGHKEDQQIEFGNPGLQQPNEFGNSGLEQPMEFGNPGLQQPKEFGNPGLQQPIDRADYQPGYRVGDAGTNSGSAWDSIRAANGTQTNAWDRVRGQNHPQSPSQYQHQQHHPQQRPSYQQQRYSQSRSGYQQKPDFEDTWSDLNRNESGLYSGNDGFSDDTSSPFGSSSALGSEDFPRSREDFERGSSGSSGRYGGSAFPA
ncbi:hypothetical protein GGI11_001336 [Coemansia sp. RSA 2049]|nr:hypothetical protein GGI11_001336 [Coemansia sp. RSA 2049]